MSVKRRESDVLDWHCDACMGSFRVVAQFDGAGVDGWICAGCAIAALEAIGGYIVVPVARAILRRELAREAE